MQRVSPSRWPRRLLIAALAAVAMCVAIYLGLYQLRVIGAVWDPLFGRGSELVLDSKVSTAIRRFTIVPDSILGALAYGCEIILALIGSSRRWLLFLFRLNTVALALAAVALVGLQAFVIHAGCFLCLVSAAISLTIAVTAAAERHP